jgi:hypothetical protein
VEDIWPVPTAETLKPSLEMRRSRSLDSQAAVKSDGSRRGVCGQLQWLAQLLSCL